MTVKHQTRAAEGACVGVTGSTAYRSNFVENYPDVPLHPLDGPIPTD